MAASTEIEKPILLHCIRNLVLRGKSDEYIAAILGVSLTDLAAMAWDDKEFFDALTPTDAEAAEYAERQRSYKERRKRQKQRILSTPSGRIQNSIRARMWAALKGRADGSLTGRLGYSIKELADHLESKFSIGMTWENYGKWHIDHIRPCASFDQSDEV